MTVACIDACRPRNNDNCEGCQYAAWSADSEYLAVSSDSHAAVAVWRIKLRDEASLDPDVLGEALFAQLLECAAVQKEKDILKAMLPVALWRQVEEALAVCTASSSGAGATAQGKQQDQTKKNAALGSSTQHAVAAALDATHVTRSHLTARQCVTAW